jgi:hypothetical protein
LVVGDVVSQEDPVRPWLRGFLPPASNASSSVVKESRPPNCKENLNGGGGLNHHFVARDHPSMIQKNSLICPTSYLTVRHQARPESEFHAVVSVPFLDHCAMVQVAPGPKSFEDHSLPALLVAIDVVTAQASRTHNESCYMSNQFRSAVITVKLSSHSLLNI